MKLDALLVLQAFVASSNLVQATLSDSHFKHPRASIALIRQIHEWKKEGFWADPNVSLGFPDKPAWGWNKAPAKVLVRSRGPGQGSSVGPELERKRMGAQPGTAGTLDACCAISPHGLAGLQER